MATLIDLKTWQPIPIGSTLLISKRGTTMSIRGDLVTLLEISSTVKAIRVKYEDGSEEWVKQDRLDKAELVEENNG